MPKLDTPYGWNLGLIFLINAELSKISARIVFNKFEVTESIFLGNEEYEGSTEYDLDDYAWTTQSTSTQQYIIEKYTVPNTGINYGDIPVMPGHAIPPMYTSATPTVVASSSLTPVTTTSSIVLNPDQKKAPIQK